MVPRTLGRCGLKVSPLGFGAFKIGRNQNVKYAHGYALPDEDAAARLLHAVLDLGITYLDTAPAYGLSEERIGQALAGRSGEFVLSTKAGEAFANGQSHYDFSAGGIRQSIQRSLQRLGRDAVDIVFLHSDGRDLWIQQQTDAVATLQDLKQKGLIRAIGLSGKTPEGTQAALEWADVVMVEYHLQNRSYEDVLAQAMQRGVGVVVKKALASGTLDAATAIRFVLANPAVASVVVGGLNVEHLQQNIRSAEQAFMTD